MSESLPAAAPTWGATIAHAADYYRRYPGETVTLFTRVSVQQPLSEFTVRISVPEGLMPGESQASANHDGSLPHLVFVDEQRYFIWTVKREVQPGERFEYQLEATIAPHLRPTELSSRAVLVLANRSGNGTPPNFPTEMVTLAVSPQGRLLKYLPAIYTEQDELMGRFLMLFESFWEPVEDRIDHIDYYFDSKLAPPDLLPWLASWIDLALDEQWPEEKRRQLLRAMVPLYRQRGTRRGLQAYLEIYTGQKARIQEHRAHNFQLGRVTRLGSSAALGRNNLPHTFTVTLRLPPAHSEQERRERRRKLENIIEAEKPAHTAYTLIIEETL